MGMIYRFRIVGERGTRWGARKSSFRAGCGPDAWHVFDLEGGPPRPVAPLPGSDWSITDIGLYGTFAQGPALVKRVMLNRHRSAAEGTGLESREEIWSIDPASARVRKLALPDGQTLVTADETRWLLGERLEHPKGQQPRPRAYSLYDPVSGALRPLFLGIPQDRYFLVHGRDELLIYSSEQGWSRRAIGEK